MALLWADSFDHYGVGGETAMLAGAWTQIGESGTFPVISTEQARTGTRCIKWINELSSSQRRLIRRNFPTAKLVVGVGVGVYFTNLPSTSDIIGVQLRNSSNVGILSVFFQSDGSISVRAGTEAGTIIAASDPVLNAASWDHVEIKAIFDTVVGEVEIRVNGLAVITMTDLNLGAVGASQVVFGKYVSTSGTYGIFYVDDVFAWDDNGTLNNDFIGPMRVETIFPVADTAATDWVRNTGASDFAALDDVPPDADTTYLAGAGLGDISEFVLDTLPPETALIAGVFIPIMAKLEAAGLGNVQVSLVSGADVSAGPDQVLTTAYAYWDSIHETDPATDLPWTKAGLEAALVRIEKTV